jgi:hypothetical protein
MVFQYIILAALFTASVIYLINIFRKQFFSKEKGCSKGCGCALSAVKLPVRNGEK